jgi:uncharacterized membrane protein YkvA (DUF1232 family)
MNFSELIYNWYKSIIRNPKYRWWIIAGSLVYLVSPIDISPDFIPIIGWIDDGMIATLLVAEVSQILMERLKAKPEANVADAPSPASDQTSASQTGAGTQSSGTVDVQAVAVNS